MDLTGPATADETDPATNEPAFKCFGIVPVLGVRS